MWFDPVILNSLMLFCLVQSSVTLVQIYRFTGLNSPCKWFIGVGICILKAAKIEKKGLHSFRHTFATRLVNGIKQADGTIRSLTPRQVADILGHSTSQITELYYVKKDTKRLSGLTNGFEL